MSLILFFMSQGSMSHLDFEKSLCRRVKFRSQGPYYDASHRSHNLYAQRRVCAPYSLYNLQRRNPILAVSVPLSLLAAGGGTFAGAAGNGEHRAAAVSAGLQETGVCVWGGEVEGGGGTPESFFFFKSYLLSTSHCYMVFQPIKC